MGTTLASDADILKRIEAFCSNHEIKPTTFGRMAIGDGNLVANLRARRSLTLKTANKVVEFIERHPASSQAAA